MIRTRRGFLATPHYSLIRKKGLSEAEVMSWFEENNSDC